MSNQDMALRNRVRDAWHHDDSESSFEAIWRRAEANHAASRRRYTGFAAAAVIIAVVAIAFGVRAPVDESTYIEMAELLDSTYWSAPSDALLPEKEFVIYKELPALFEST